MAAGAMGVLNDNGIDVPEISLIGFDDVLISRYVRPRLTTVRYPIVTVMATRAAELALALAEKRPAPEITHVFNPTLVRRHSVSALTEPGNSSSSD